jgi:hypothetical protein
MADLVKFVHPYRTTRILYMMTDDRPLYPVTGCPHVIVQLEVDNLWWIVPNFSLDDPFFDDLGPFETPDGALAMCLLTFGTKYVARDII